MAEALQASQAATATRLVFDRQWVLPGLVEAVAVAWVKADAHALIRAWSEIGRKCELYGS